MESKMTVFWSPSLRSAEDETCEVFGVRGATFGPQLVAPPILGGFFFGATGSTEGSIASASHWVAVMSGILESWMQMWKNTYITIWLFVDWEDWVWTPGSRTGEGVHWPGGWRQSQGGSEVFTSWLTVPPWDRQTPEKMSGCPSWWLGPGPESSWAYTSQHSVVCKSI